MAGKSYFRLREFVIDAGEGVNLGLSFPPKNVKNVLIFLFFDIRNMFVEQ